MNNDDFRKWAHTAADWSADYLTGIGERPVRSQSEPGAVLQQIAKTAPEQAEDMQNIFEDFKSTVPDAMTHWQHPRFFAYFSVCCGKPRRPQQNLKRQ